LPLLGLEQIIARDLFLAVPSSLWAVFSIFFHFKQFLQQERSNVKMTVDLHSKLLNQAP
jgi:hypothetical protein